MATTLELLIRAKDLASNVIKGIGDTAEDAGSRSQGAFGRVGHAVEGVRARLGSVAKAAGVALAAAAAAAGVFAVKFGKDAVDAASTLNETVSKARTIFGPAAADLERWGAGTADALGQSKQQALDAAATFGNLFVQLGIGTDQAAGMSKEMVELASDFASFHNADITQVLDAQTAAFRGEYDALQRFVPTINAAAVEQRALELTGKATTKELTLQEKALATQKLMLEGAGDAAGDFARTSDSLANKQRIAAAQVEDLKAKVGQALLPAMTVLVGFISGRVLPAVEDMGRFFANTGRLIADVWRDPDITNDGFVGFIERVVSTARGLFDLFASGNITNALKVGLNIDEDSPLIRVLLTVRDVAMTVGSFVADNLQPILIGLGATVAALLAPWAALAAAALYAYTQFDVVRSAVDAVVKFFAEVVVPAVVELATAITKQFASLVDWARTHWSSIQEAIGHVLRVVGEIVGVFVDTIAAAWRAWGDDLERIAKRVFSGIRDFIASVIDVIRSTIKTVLAVINGDWGKAWDGIKGIVSGVWGAMRAIVETAIGVIKSLLGGALSSFAQVWQGVWDKVKSIARLAVDGVVGFVSGIPGRVLGFIGSIGAAFLAIGQEAIKQLGAGLSGAVDLAGDIAAAVARAVKGAINSVIDLLNDAIPNSLGWGPARIDLPNNPIPRLHQGGVFFAPTPGGEGWALLRDRERVIAPSGSGAAMSDGDVVRRLDDMLSVLRALLNRRFPVDLTAHLHDETDLEMFMRRFDFATTGIV